MNPSNHSPTYGNSPNYAANYAYSASETLLREVRGYLAKQGGPNDLEAIVEAALAALSACRDSLQRGHDVPPDPDVLAAIDQAIDAVVLMHIRTDAQVDIGTETQLVEVRRVRAMASPEPRQQHGAIADSGADR
jgi:hypothetical protein